MRGKGLWLAVEFVKDRGDAREGLRGGGRGRRGAACENGLYPIHDSISWFVRIQPPLNIERALFEQGLDILEEAIRRQESEQSIMNGRGPLDRGALERVLLPFGPGRLLPREAYTSQEVLDWEQRHFFEGSWVCAGRADDVARAGRPEGAYASGSDGILLVRGEDGRLRAFYNVCRHRAHELLQAGECTNEPARSAARTTAGPTSSTARCTRR